MITLKIPFNIIYPDILIYNLIISNFFVNSYDTSCLYLKIIIKLLEPPTGMKSNIKNVDLIMFMADSFELIQTDINKF